MPVLGEESFEAAVRKVMNESKVSEESARRIVGDAERKKRIAKLRLAAIGVNFGKPERREKIQNYKKTKDYEDAAATNALDKQTQDRVTAEVDYINTGNKIMPPKKPMDVKLRKRMAQEQKIAQEHKHSIVFRNQRIDKGLFRAASLVEHSGKYAKYWLLNAKQVNGNGWGISAKTAKENMQKFVGRPFVITSSKWHGASEYGTAYEHPYLPTNNMDKIFSHQEKFRVGNIVKIAQDEHEDFFAIIEMNPKFAHLSLPPFCSPAIYQLNAMEREDDISEWEALHLAGLDENPAYGAKVALLKGTCIGTEHACSIQFRTAKQETQIACPIKVNKVREKLAGISSYGKPTKPMEITAFGKPKPFTEEEQKDLDKATRPFNQRGFKEPDKMAQIKYRLAGLSNNIREKQMDSPPTDYTDEELEALKNKKKQKKASSSVEEALRGRGRSVDGSHAQSTFLTSRGDFVGGDGIHVNQLGILDEQMESKLKEYGLIRVQNFPINRAGEKKTSVGLVSRPTAEQLKAIRDLEAGGQVVGFAVGPTGREITGNGYRDMMGALRKSGLL